MFSRFRLRLFVADEYKPLSLVSLWLWVVTIGALLFQVAFHRYVVPPPISEAINYEKPPRQALFNVLSLGEPVTLARLLALRLQAFDNQPGISIPFRELDYDNLGLWFDRVVALDERAEYPHFLIAKIYSSVSDDERRRKTIDWVTRQFLERPNERWEWMGHVTNMAKYVLKDDELSIKLARIARNKTTPGKVPSWVREMEIFFLENQDEFEAAASMLEEQLIAGEVTEPQEFTFLSNRLQGMLKNLYERGDISDEELAERLRKIEELTDGYLRQYDIK